MKPKTTYPLALKAFLAVTMLGVMISGTFALQEYRQIRALKDSVQENTTRIASENGL